MQLRLLRVFRIMGMMTGYEELTVDKMPLFFFFFYFIYQSGSVAKALTGSPNGTASPLKQKVQKRGRGFSFDSLRCSTLIYPR